MKVDLQPVSGILRIWNDPDAKYGDPYDWCCTVKWLTETKVELLGVDKPVTPAMWRAIQDALAERGIEEFLAVRKTVGKTRERWISTKRRHG